MPCTNILQSITDRSSDHVSAFPFKLTPNTAFHLLCCSRSPNLLVYEMQLLTFFSWEMLKLGTRTPPHSFTHSISPSVNPPAYSPSPHPCTGRCGGKVVGQAQAPSSLQQLRPDIKQHHSHQPCESSLPTRRQFCPLQQLSVCLLSQLRLWVF